MTDGSSNCPTIQLSKKMMRIEAVHCDAADSELRSNSGLQFDDIIKWPRDTKHQSRTRRVPRHTTRRLLINVIIYSTETEKYSRLRWLEGIFHVPGFLC
jgi:hypothetical protein